ncbi:MAG: hypothetical protein M1840_002356 [Geoglossum simile]|nr:MAG: hypothetical protein M1840_002356 [Geoglossum simile]
MASPSREHIAWLQVVGDEDFYFCDPSRMTQVAESLTNPGSQYPSCVFFIGKRQKDIAIRQIFTHNNIRRGCSNGIANLRVDSNTVGSKHPILFADGDPHIQIPPRQEVLSCHRQVIYPIAWKPHPQRKILDVAYSRILFLFSDVICLFADDLGGLEEVALLLTTWALVGDASGLPKEIRPKVIIITSGNSSSATFDVLEMESFCFSVTRGSPVDLRKTFSSITLMHLANQMLSPLARYRPLKEELLRQFDQIRQLRHQKHCLFSANHLQAFYRFAIQHAAGSATLPINFVMASRTENEVRSDYADHLLTFLQSCVQFKLPYDDVSSFIASSILMDAYPPGMHMFDPRETFRTLYKPFCLKALAQAYNSGSFTDHMCEKIENHVELMFANNKNTSAAELHSSNLKLHSLQWAQVKSNRTCLCCLRRRPEHFLNCGHSICDTCVRIFGTVQSTIESQFTLHVCVLCDRRVSSTIVPKPATAGIRILSIDGGGVRGVIPLEFLRSIQDTLGPRCPVQSFFDLAFGTSAGGLIILGMFLRQWDISYCSRIFEQLAKRCFRKRRLSGLPILCRVNRLLKCWTCDGCYDTVDLEASLKQCFGSQKCFDTPESSFSGAKVGVTATTISNATPFIFSNYNGEGTRNASCGYKHLRPRDVKDEPFVWEAARATSAAPVLFQTAQISTVGAFQDGGLKHNNPVYLALWESDQIWTSHATRDVVLSLGTGTESDPMSPVAPSFRHFLVDGFIPRLYRSSMSSLDGEITWKHLQNSLDEKSKSDYFRLNVPLQGEPVLDDTACMDKLRESVRSFPSLGDYIDIAAALLVSSFYFELTALPRFEGGLYKCNGTIRCRGHSDAIIESLFNLHYGRLEFAADSRLLGSLDPETDFCQQCHRYRKRISFYVQKLNETVTLCLVAKDVGKRRKLSGFPQSIEWFIQQQHLEATFGTADHGCPGRLRCADCDSRGEGMRDISLKRKGGLGQSHSRKKICI